MLQIISISEARTNLAKLVQKINDTQKPVIIVQDSTPIVVVYPYTQIIKNDEEEALFQAQFQDLLSQGKQLFNDFKKQNGVKNNLTEEEAYTLIKHG